MSSETRAVLRFAARVADAGAARLWPFAFTVVGRFDGRRPVRWVSPGGQRIVVVAPHPDDDVLGMGGTIVKHRQQGDEVHVVYVTDGRRSRALGLDEQAMARRRRAEVDAAASVLTLRAAHWMGLPEGDWEVDTARAALGRVLATIGPDVLYAPSRIDFHPEHVRTAQALALALSDYGATPIMRIYPCQVPLTPLLVNTVSDVSAVVPDLSAAIAAHATQSANASRAYRRRALAARYFHEGAYAEEFWEVTVAAYCALHRAVNEPSAHSYRSLRARAFVDPLAYLTGRRERTRLRAIVDALGR